MTISTLVRLVRPRRMIVLAVALLIAGCSSGGGAASSTPPAGSGSAGNGASRGSSTTIKVVDGHLVDGAGRTVYLWVADAHGASSCAGACASVWPPVPAPGTAGSGAHLLSGALGTLTRSDGRHQLSYAEHPLYYFADDKSAGQTSGQGSDSFGAKWWEVSAAGQAITMTGPGPQTPAPQSSSASSGRYNY